MALQQIIKECTVAELKFCEEIVSGKKADDAFFAAYGYSQATTGCSNADRILKKPHVLLKLAELRANLEEKYEAERDLVVSELINLAMTDVSEFLDFDADGVRVKSSNSLTKKQLRCVQSITSTSTPSGTVVKLQMADRLGAWKELSKILGLTNDTNIGSVQQFVIHAPAPVASSAEWEAIARKQLEVVKEIEHMPADSQSHRPEPSREEDDRNREFGTSEPYNPSRQLKIDR